MESKIKEAMCFLDAELVQEAAQPAVRKKRKFRTLLVAACLAVMCAIGVAAVSGFIGDAHWKLQFWENAALGEQFEVKATYGGTILRAEGAEELKAAIETGREFISSDGMQHIVHDTKKNFTSLTELEDYLGVDLLETPLKPVEACHIVAFYNSKVDDTLYVDVFYRGEKTEESLPPTNLHINAYICTTEAVTLSILSELPKELSVSEYHIETLDVTAYLATDEHFSRGYFNADGIAYEVLLQGEADTLRHVLETFTE